jgi:hypothetical protein
MFKLCDLCAPCQMFCPRSEFFLGPPLHRGATSQRRSIPGVGGFRGRGVPEGCCMGRCAPEVSLGVCTESSDCTMHGTSRARPPSNFIVCCFKITTQQNLCMHTTTGPNPQQCIYLYLNANIGVASGFTNG